MLSNMLYPVQEIVLYDHETGHLQGNDCSNITSVYICLFHYVCQANRVKLQAGVLDAQTQNGDEPVGEYSFLGQSCLSSADS